MNLKELKEKRIELLEDMKNQTSNIEIFDSVRFDSMKAEFEEIEARISEFDNAEQIKIKNITKKESDNKMKLKDMLLQGKSVDLSKVNNAGEMVTADHEAIEKETFEATIEKRVEEECLLFGKVRKIVTACDHNIPVQAEKLDRLLNVKEMAEYTKAMPEYKKVVLGAEKYGLVVVASEEILEDAGYDLERDIQDQLVEAFAKTMEDIIINGDKDNGVQGLLSADEAKVVTVAEVDYDAVVDLVFALKKAHRRDACLIVGDEFLKAVMKMKDQQGEPLLRRDIVDLKEADIAGRIMGVPVIVTDALPEDVMAIHTDLARAMVVGVRRGIQVKKSDQVLFMVDGVAFKANARIDAKVLDAEAIAVLKKA